jgi:hypothetical protein
VGELYVATLPRRSRRRLLDLLVAGRCQRRAEGERAATLADVAGGRAVLQDGLPILEATRVPKLQRRHTLVRVIAALSSREIGRNVTGFRLLAYRIGDLRYSRSCYHQHQSHYRGHHRQLLQCSYLLSISSTTVGNVP